jgi:hypothetical protein
MRIFHRQCKREIKCHVIVNNLVSDTHSLLFGDHRTFLSGKISVGATTEQEMVVGGGGIGLDRGNNEVACEKEHTAWESRRMGNFGIVSAVKPCGL